jgi:hypothetical protein
VPTLTPLAVPPPSGGLRSSTNYILASTASGQCNPITDLVVTIDVTRDIVLKSSSGFWYSGFGFQLNCYSPPGFVDAWQQYIFVVLSAPIGSSYLCGAVNNWTAKEDQLVEEVNTLLQVGGNAIPAGYQLQMRLTNDANNNIVGIHWIVNDLGFLPAPTTALTGYWRKELYQDANDPNSVQHVYYIGIDGHIHERAHYPTGNYSLLAPDGIWVHNDLTVLSGNSMAPTVDSALDAYVDAGSSQHVNFIGTDGHVHELYIARDGGQWVNNDLSLLAKGVLSMPGTPLDGYADTGGGQHVNFIGVDGHVHELFIASGGHWIDNDLTVLSGNGVVPRANSPLDGYIDADDGQHVNFIGTDGHVHELYIKPHGQWINNDLTALSGNGVTPSRTSSLCGYLGPDNGQHVNFIGTDGRVHELYIHPNAQWINNDLTQLSGNGVPPTPNSPLCGYWASGDTQHVNFIGTDGHVHELYITPNGHWINNDLTLLSSNSMPPAPNTRLHSYAQPDGAQHVNYIGVYDAHMHELYIPSGGHWVNNDLNNIELVNVSKDPLDLSSGQFAPINAFQLNLVGPINSDNAVLSSGAGTFTFSADTPLTVASTFPPCTGVTWPTGETANSVYGTLDAGPSNLITQTFSTDPNAAVVHVKGKVAPGVKLPIKPGEAIKPVPAGNRA